MLFSNEQIASFINQHFEPAWQSVRPVPIVNIAFNEKLSITRTLHGNIATYICTPKGQVIDVLPGAYTPETYLSQLRQLKLTYDDVTASDQPLSKLIEYHAQRFQLLAIREELAIQDQPDVPKAQVNLADFSKVAVVEKPIEAALKPVHTQEVTSWEVGSKSFDEEILNSLELDTIHNETIRRLDIHKHLGRSGWKKPDFLTKWLYREVLNTDLDDPYLGLEEALFANYPFTENAN